MRSGRRLLERIGVATAITVVAVGAGVALAAGGGLGRPGGGGHRYLLLVYEDGNRAVARLEIVRGGRVEATVARGAIAAGSWAPKEADVLAWRTDSGALWVARRRAGAAPRGFGRGPVRLGAGRERARLEPYAGRLWAASSEGRESRVVAHTHDWNWLPGGHRLVVVVAPRERVLAIDIRTGRRVDITPPAGRGSSYSSPQSSPTGRLISYTRFQGSMSPLPGSTLRLSLVVAPPDGPSVRSLVTVYRARVPSTYDPNLYPTIASDPFLSRLEELGWSVAGSWSPDRRKIAFTLPGPVVRGIGGWRRVRIVDVATRQGTRPAPGAAGRARLVTR